MRKCAGASLCFCLQKGEIGLRQGMPLQPYTPTEPRFRSEKNVADARLVRNLASHACMTLSRRFLKGSVGIYGCNGCHLPKRSKHICVLYKASCICCAVF